MRKMGLALAVAGTVFSCNANANDVPVKCSDFVEMPKAEQTAFTSGMINGVGTVFGVLDTFSRMLEKSASTSEEKDGIRKMRSSPIGFLSKGCCRDHDAVQKDIVEACHASPEKYVGNVLTDILAGINKSK